jgi:hypothetical protein
VEDVKKAGEVLSSESEDKPKPRGHKPKHGVARTEIAEAIGTSETAIIEAEQHVETAEKFPFIQGEAKVGSRSVLKFVTILVGSLEAVVICKVNLKGCHGIHIGNAGAMNTIRSYRKRFLAAVTCHYAPRLMLGRMNFSLV